jgi:hypothetical protein
LLPIAPAFIERIKRAALAGDDVFGALAPRSTQRPQAS